MDAHLLAARQHPPAGPSEFPGTADMRQRYIQWYDLVAVAIHVNKYKDVLCLTNHLIDPQGLVSHLKNLDNFRMARALGWRGHCLKQRHTMSDKIEALSCYSAARDKFHAVSTETNWNVEERDFATSHVDIMAKECDLITRDIERLQDSLDKHSLNTNDPVIRPGSSSSPQQSHENQERDLSSRHKQRQILAHAHPSTIHPSAGTLGSKEDTGRHPGGCHWGTPDMAEHQGWSGQQSQSTQSLRIYTSPYKSNSQRGPSSPKGSSNYSSQDFSIHNSLSGFNPLFGRSSSTYPTDHYNKLGHLPARIGLAAPVVTMSSFLVPEEEHQRRHRQAALDSVLGRLRVLAKDTYRNHNEVIGLTGSLLDGWKMHPFERAEVTRIRAMSFHRQMTRLNNIKALRNIEDALRVLGEFKPEKWEGPYFKSLAYAVKKWMQAYQKDHREIDKYFRLPSYSKLLAQEVLTAAELHKYKFTMKEKLELTDQEWMFREEGMPRSTYGM